MKKLFGIVAGVAVSAALMTGCGGNNNTCLLYTSDAADDR